MRQASQISSLSRFQSSESEHAFCSSLPGESFRVVTHSYSYSCTLSASPLASLQRSADARRRHFLAFLLGRLPLRAPEDEREHHLHRPFHRPTRLVSPCSKHKHSSKIICANTFFGSRCLGLLLPAGNLLLLPDRVYRGQRREKTRVGRAARTYTFLICIRTNLRPVTASISMIDCLLSPIFSSFIRQYSSCTTSLNSIIFRRSSNQGNQHQNNVNRSVCN